MLEILSFGMKEKCDIFILRFPLKSNKFDQGPEAVLPSEDKLR